MLIYLDFLVLIEHEVCQLHSLEKPYWHFDRKTSGQETTMLWTKAPCNAHGTVIAYNGPSWSAVKFIEILHGSNSTMKTHCNKSKQQHTKPAPPIAKANIDFWTKSLIPVLKRTGWTIGSASCQTSGLRAPRRLEAFRANGTSWDQSICAPRTLCAKGMWLGPLCSCWHDLARQWMGRHHPLEIFPKYPKRVIKWKMF